MPDIMTSKERWLAALQGQPVDRVPFWPKVGGAYSSYQQEPFHSMGDAELHRWIGSDRHVGGPSCVRPIRSKTSIERATENDVQTTVYRTPAGTLTSVDGFEPVSRTWHPREFPVKTPDDIETMTQFYADETCEFDPDQLERAETLIRDLDGDAIATTGIGISPLMDWLQHLAGIENGHLFLADHRGAVEALFEQMHRVLCRRAEIAAAHSPCPVIYSVENTSTTLISPEMFREYCLEHLMDYGRIIRGAGKFHVLHMCGHLKKLLPDIATLPATGIEAFTSPPVGNTLLVDGRTALPEKCLIGGTSAVQWLEPAETIIATIERDLAALPHARGIVLTSAGVMPPACQPETIRKVAEWLRGYPAS